MCQMDLTSSSRIKSAVLEVKTDNFLLQPTNSCPEKASMLKVIYGLYSSIFPTLFSSKNRVVSVSCLEDQSPTKPRQLNSDSTSGRRSSNVTPSRRFGGRRKRQEKYVRAKIETTSDRRALNVQFPTLAEFHFRRTIGQGTFSEVKLVEHSETGSSFAMKVSAKAHFKRKKQVQRILEEKSILAELRHPHVVKLYSTFNDSKYVYLLFEYLPFGDLHRYLQAQRRLSPAEARFCVGCVVSALSHLHGLGVAHRDLKLENMLLDHRGYLKLADFGFAKKIGANNRSYSTCGTVEYTAPEMIKDEGHDQMVDWWAVGILLYELLCGYTPFAPNGLDDNNSTYNKILSGEFIIPNCVSAQAKDLIKRLLVQDPKVRLGCNRGAEEIKLHPWMNNFDWSGLDNGNLKSPLQLNEDPWRNERDYDVLFFESFEEVVGTPNGFRELDIF